MHFEKSNLQARSMRLVLKAKIEAFLWHEIFLETAGPFQGSLCPLPGSISAPGTDVAFPRPLQRLAVRLPIILAGS